MASVMRPILFRQLPRQRLFSTAAGSGSPSVFRISAPLRRCAARPASLKDALPGAMRIAAFHSYGKQAILPAEPQRIKGTANDPAPVLDPAPTHGSYHWSFERVVAAALVPLTVAPFAAGSLHPVMDATFCGLLVIHSHFGFESIIVDYIPQHRVPKARTVFTWGLRAGTLLVAVGLYEFETNDVGVTEAVKRIWKA